MPTYRKGLALYQAAQLPSEKEDASQELLDLLHAPDNVTLFESDRDGGLVIHYPTEEPVRAEPLDWIVRSAEGICYRVKPDTFKALYERVEE